MSLKVWLPLDGDLENKGISDLQFSYSGNNITSNTQGKIGSCYQRTARAGDAIISNKAIDLGINQSMFCWIKIDAFNSSSSLTGILGQHRYATNTGMGITIKYISATTGRLSVNTGTGSARTYVTYLGNTILNANEWYHVGYTYDGSTIRLYVNGAEDGTHAFTGMSCPADYIQIGNWAFSSTTLTNTSIGNYSALGYINDVRIYDHYLSAAEVREIAQGLVLHYKLDNTCAFTDLIARNVNVTAYNNHGNTNNPTTITYLSTHYYGDRIIQYSATPTENAISSIQSSLSSHGIYNWRQTFKANTKYVFWIYYKPISHPDTRCGGTASNIGGWTEIPPVEVGDGWYRVGQYRNGTVTSDKSDNIFVSYKTPSAQVGDTIIIQFAAPHLIEGMMEIPPYDYSSDIIEDSSGYNHNGTLAGTVIVTSETPRYNVSTHFSANNQYIHVSNLTTSGFGSTYTFAWWEKRATYSNTMAWGFQNGIRLNGLYNGNLWNTGDSSNNPLYKPGTTTAVTVPTVNVWHHFAMVADGSTCKVYQDGELWAQAKTFKQISGTNLYINGWDSGTSYKSTDMSVSDFRLYATPLLDTDIKQLYNVGMKVDKLGNVHTSEFVEKSDGSEAQTDNQSVSLATYSTSTTTESKHFSSATVSMSRVTRIYTTQIPLLNVSEFQLNWPTFTYTTRTGSYYLTTGTQPGSRYYKHGEWRIRLLVYDANNELQTTINIVSGSRSSAGSTSALASEKVTVSNFSKQIQIEQNTNYIYGKLEFSYIASAVTCNGTATCSTYVPPTIVTPQLIKTGQFYNRIINEINFNDSHTQILKDGMILSRNFIEK